MSSDNNETIVELHKLITALKTELAELRATVVVLAAQNNNSNQENSETTSYVAYEEAPQDYVKNYLEFTRRLNISPTNSLWHSLEIRRFHDRFIVSFHPEFYKNPENTRRCKAFLAKLQRHIYSLGYNGNFNTRGFLVAILRQSKQQASDVDEAI